MTKLWGRNGPNYAHMDKLKNKQTNKQNPTKNPTNKTT
jgi:hypothetical protein